MLKNITTYYKGWEKFWYEGPPQKYRQVQHIKKNISIKSLQALRRGGSVIVLLNSSYCQEWTKQAQDMEHCERDPYLLLNSTPQIFEDEPEKYEKEKKTK